MSYARLESRQTDSKAWVRAKKEMRAIWSNNSRNPEWENCWGKPPQKNKRVVKRYTIPSQSGIVLAKKEHNWTWVTNSSFENGDQR